MICPLCEDIQKRIHLGEELEVYYEDSLVILADALIKKGHKNRVILMSKKHIANPSEKFIKYARRKARAYLPFTDFISTHGMPSISDHYHEIYSDLIPIDDHLKGIEIKKHPHKFLFYE